MPKRRFSALMDISITWSDIVVRLLASLLAGSLLGLNRGQHGRPAGLRTTALVCLTAAASMVLANLLLDTTGKPADSFVNFDVMRLPLGILTGVGFIGAGAILHKGNLVLGVTTAATLWFATVMGFFFGGGEFETGLLLLLLGAIILWLMDWIEGRLPSRHDATLIVRFSTREVETCDIVKELRNESFRAMPIGIEISGSGEERRYKVSWHATAQESKIPRLISQLAKRSEIETIKWDAVGRE